ncbi:hypothetical protein [Shewanella sp. 10N.286.48.B5]|uniref:hypothetical protein n=1 Tax=Shewanella sp. 10N.286.48.B5 TaxID=1880834 RepID=UPI000C820E5F|nr:hypothetical protein [Shewanella sp. 10N.286.48.B5]PMH88124.1 hypothetical protein BCU57_04880 [Shewanella sp. 10N.286.48.B5]
MKSTKQKTISAEHPISVDDKNEKRSSLSRRDFGKIAAGLGLASVVGSSSVFAQENKGSPSHEESKTSATPEGYEGNIAVCTVLIVKEEMEKETDNVWDNHKQWLKESHGPWGMVSYTVAKHKELKYPLNPENGETTNRIVYVIHEVYRHIDGLNKHYAECRDGNYLDEFIRICTTEGNSFTVLQGAPVTHSLLPKDCDFPITFNS